MIIDLPDFLTKEQPLWTELEFYLDRFDRGTEEKLSLRDVKRFHYLSRRVAADLAKISTFASEPEVAVYLESLVARTYAEVHETRRHSPGIAVVKWFFGTFPRTVRKHQYALLVSVAITLIGSAMGAGALYFDADAKDVIMPFSHLAGDPSDRVAREEDSDEDRLEGHKTSFSATLMTHNTRVSITAMALGAAYGLGTIILLFYNGVILGAVACDYILAGESTFLLGWLLPHGVIEIPAILIAGQGGLILGHALIGWGTAHSMKTRMRHITPDLVTLMFGVALMLVWAGIIEAFFSQYHEPVIPYALKIGFGIVEFALLGVFLSRSGLKTDSESKK